MADAIITVGIGAAIVMAIGAVLMTIVLMHDEAIREGDRDGY